MPIALGLFVQFAFFGYGALRLGAILYRWLILPRESVVRLVEDQRADPARAAEREGMQSGLLVPAACAAWLWADLGLIWLFAAVVLGLSAVSAFLSARRMRRRPDPAPARRAKPSNAEIDGLAARGQQIGATASGLGLSLWLYSWWRPLVEMLQYLSSSAL